MVRYVHLPGGAVDTALLEDGLYPAPIAASGSKADIFL